MVVAGGYADIAGVVSYSEAHDFRMNLWTELPPMNIRRSALYMNCLNDHDTIDELITPAWGRGNDPHYVAA